MTSSKIKFVPKGWGFEKWIVNNKEYCGKWNSDHFPVVIDFMW